MAIDSKQPYNVHSDIAVIKEKMEELPIKTANDASEISWELTIAVIAISSAITISIDC